MMTEKEINVYCVMDLKAEMFDVPFFARNDLFAGRKFMMDIRNRKDSMVSSFKDDFELYKIGSFDMDKGEFISDGRKLILKGLEVENNGNA